LLWRRSFLRVLKWVGAAAIGENFAKIVREQRVRWTVDQVLTDVDRSAAVLEWSRFNPANAQLVRGVEWFVFDPGTLKIKEVRPYTAAALHADMARQELQDFDYEGRGYPTAPFSFRFARLALQPQKQVRKPLRVRKSDQMAARKRLRVHLQPIPSDALLEREWKEAIVR
jgi:hypothetical protein